MNCETYKNYIEKYVDGTISESELAELKAHTETCQGCREEFEGCVGLENVVREAFSSQTGAEQAKESLMNRLSAEPGAPVRRIRYGPAWFVGRRASIAAGILLAIGLTLGFYMGRASIVEPPLAAKVPMRVSELDGTVLVKHKGFDTWQTLEDGANVYLGDTFQSSVKSGFVLELKDKSTIEVNQNSMLALKLYNGQTQFHLEHGRCTADLQSPHPPFFISTPHGRVEALGTEFTVTVE